MDGITEEQQQHGPSPASPSPATLLWEEIAVFRESFLRLLHPESAAAFRTVGQLLYDWAIEDQFSFGRSSQSWLLRDLRGAVADLRFLEGFLADLGRSSQLSHLDVEEERIALVATKMSIRIRTVAERLEIAARTMRGANTAAFE